MIDCNEWKTEKCHECHNMEKVKWLKLWWQLYRTSLPERDVRNIRWWNFIWLSVQVTRRKFCCQGVQSSPLGCPSAAAFNLPCARYYFCAVALTHSFKCALTCTLFNLLPFIIIFFPIAACHWWIIWMLWACVLGIRNNNYRKYIYLCLFVPGFPDSKAVSYFQPLLNFFPYGIKK